MAEARAPRPTGGAPMLPIFSHARLLHQALGDGGGAGGGEDAELRCGGEGGEAADFVAGGAVEDLDFAAAEVAGADHDVRDAVEVDIGGGDAGAVIVGGAAERDGF